MDLRSYLNGKCRKTFAEQIGTTTNYINNLCWGGASPGKNLALRIEQATGGAVTLRELLFPEQANGGQPKA